MTCSEEDCDQPVIQHPDVKGMCAVHVFWTKVEKTETCWLWTGQWRSKGYGMFGGGGVPKPAHRIAYELLVGPIPDGLQLDHLCRVRACCNPEHLEPVTPRENVLRGAGVAAAYARRDHCKNGHPWDEENTYYTAGRPTVRRCRQCKRENSRREYLAQKKRLGLIDETPLLRPGGRQGRDLPWLINIEGETCVVIETEASLDAARNERCA